MRAHATFVALVCAAVVGCAPGKSELSVTVDATGQLSGIDHLAVSVTDPANRHAGPYSLAVPGGTIPPSVSFALAFGSDVKGTVTVAVSAVDGNGTTLTSTQGPVQITPSHSATLSLTLDGSVVPGGGDGGMGDMAVIPGYHLVFSTQPANGTVNTALAPSVTVTLTDGSGATIMANDAVTLATATNGASARLNGATTVNAVNGVATFDNVAVDRAVNGLTLAATANSYASGTSNAFNVAGLAWRPIYTLNGGAAQQLVFDPSNPATVIALSQASTLFKSVDGGKSWFPIGYGITSGSSVTTIALDPRGNVIYAGTSSGLFKSSNGGLLFTQLANAPTAQTEELAIDPVTPDVVFVVAGGGLYKSTDAGATFAASGNGIAANQAGVILIDPHAHTNLISVGLKQYWSADGGATWTLATTAVPPNTSGVARGVAIDPHTSGVAYCGNFKTTDGGKNWSALSPLPPVSGTIVPDPVHAGTIYYGGQSRFGGQLARTTDGGMTFTTLKMLPNPSFYQPAIAVDPSNGTTVLASDVQIDILRSTDSAATWAAATQGYTCANLRSVSIDPNKAATVYVATPADGVMQSKDAGATWLPFNTNLGATAVDVVVADPSIGGRVFAAADFGNATQPRIYQADNGSWMSLGGSPTSNIQALVLEVKVTDDIYALSGGSMFVNQGGNTWSQVTLPGGCTLVDAVATDPTAAGNVYATCNNGFYHGSHTTFTQLATTLGTGTRDVAVVFDPTTPTTLYALNTGGTSIAVYKTTNSFGSAASASTGLTGNFASLLAIDPLSHSTLYVVGNHLYKTTDGAATWAPAEAGLPTNLNVNALAIDPATEGVVYAATNCGMYKTTSGGK